MKIILTDELLDWLGEWYVNFMFHEIFNSFEKFVERFLGWLENRS